MVRVGWQVGALRVCNSSSPLHSLHYSDEVQHQVNESYGWYKVSKLQFSSSHAKALFCIRTFEQFCPSLLSGKDEYHWR